MKKLLTLSLALFMSLSLIVLNVKDVKADDLSNQGSTQVQETNDDPVQIGNLDTLTNFLSSEDEKSGELTANITLDDGIIVKGTKTLDLKGYNIKANSSFEGNMFNVAGTLTVQDSSNPSAGTIDGNHTDAQTNNVRGFYVYADGILTINGGTITKMYQGDESSDGGAAISNTGVLKITGGTISDCTAEGDESMGGAINNAEDAELTISGGTIQDCSAPNYAYGGAIYNNGSLTIEKGTIQNCSAYIGGAIFDESTEVKISGGTIKGCSASQTGGAIHNYSGTVTITGGTIGGSTEDDGCTAIYGGAIYNEADATLNMLVGTGETYGTIQYCKATNAAVDDGYGGAIYNEGTLKIEKATIANCSATIDSGAIYDKSENKTLELKDVTISDCFASGSDSAGAIQVAEESTDLKISGHTSVSATSTAGAVGVKGKLIIADRATFEVKEKGAGVALVAFTGLEPENCEIKGYNSSSTTLQKVYRDASAYGLFKTADGNNAKYVIIKNITTPEPSPSKPSEPVVKDESCEKVIGPTWHWNNTKGVCEEVSVIGTSTR